MPAGRRLGLGRVFTVAICVAAAAIGIGEDEARFVGRVGFQIQNAAGKHVGQHDVDDMIVVLGAAPIDVCSC